MAKKRTKKSTRAGFAWRSLLDKYWWTLPIIILVAAGGVSAALVMRRQTASNPQKPVGMIACADTKRAEDFSCWEQRYEAMVAEQSPQAALADARQAYNTIPYVKTNCHQIAHRIGRAAGRKYGDVSQAYAQGNDFCWSGYYHGVMEAIADQMGVDKIMANINNICEGIRKEKEYSFYHYNCVHGLGHGLMAVQENELSKALKSCESLSGSWQQESCYSGVFMENVMSEINPGHKTKYLRGDDPLYPCTAVEDTYKQQCYLMQTSHALVVEKQDFSKVFALCASVASPFDATCYQSLGRDASGSSSSDPAITKQRCMLGTTQAARSNCVIGAVKDFISYFHSDKEGLAFCASLDEAALKQTCNQTAKDYYAIF